MLIMIIDEHLAENRRSSRINIDIRRKDSKMSSKIDSQIDSQICPGRAASKIDSQMSSKIDSQIDSQIKLVNL